MGSSRHMWAIYKHRQTILDRLALVLPQHSTARLWPGPYSTGWPGSSTATIDHIWREEPDAGNGDAGPLPDRAPGSRDTQKELVVTVARDGPRGTRPWQCNR
jgi:hypothetical protein